MNSGNRINKAISFIVASIMAFTVMPALDIGVVHAADEPPAVGIGTSLLKTNAGKVGAQKLLYGSESWFVLSHDGNNGDGNRITYTTSEGKTANLYRTGAVTLLVNGANEESQFRKKYASQDWSNEYDGSILQEHVRSWQHGGSREKFSVQESIAMNHVNLKGGNTYYGEDGWDSNKVKGNSTAEKLWPLSYAEATALPNELKVTDSPYFLRSPGGGAAYVFQVYPTGAVYTPNTILIPCGVRPAFDLNMNAVQFVSAADGSNKYQPCSAGYIKPTGKNTTGEWKVTLKDDGTIPGLNGHDEFSVDKVEWIDNNTRAKITYSGATTGDNEQITAIIACGDEIMYCGKIGDCDSSAKKSGTVEVKPYNLDVDNAKMYIVNEKVNPDTKTDLASSLIEITDIPHEVTGHRWKEYEKKDPTCTEPGNLEGITCTLCNEHQEWVQIGAGSWTYEVVSDEEWNIPALGHDWEYKTISWTIDPDHQKGDKEYYTCNAEYECRHDNDHKESKPADVQVTGTAPTCTEEGRWTYVASIGRDQSPDDLFHSETTTVTDDALDHDWKPATCTEPKICKRCDVTEGKALGHEYGAWTYLNGTQHQRVCQHDNTHVEKATHTWDAGKVTRAATTTATGVRTFTCTGCHGTRTETIARLPDPYKQYGTDGTPVGPGASEKAANKAITANKSDKDIKGSRFAPLKVKSTSQGKTNIKLTWVKNKKATRYVVYGNLCNVKGKKYKPIKLATVKGGSYNVKKINKTKVKKGTYYKFVVVALDKKNNVVSTSRMIHVATRGGKVGNHKSVTVQIKSGKKYKTVSKVSIKKGKSLALKVKLNPVNRKYKAQKHVGVRYETSNSRIATVSGGKIKGKSKGTCYVYVYAQNGVCKALKVTVK